MGLEPFLELILFGLVRIEALYALPYDAVSLQHLEVEVPVGPCGFLGNLPLGLYPGEVARGPRVADILVRVPDAVFQALLIQRAEGDIAGFVSFAFRVGHVQLRCQLRFITDLFRSSQKWTSSARYTRLVLVKET